MREIETRLRRLEQRQQPRSARDATDVELLRVLEISAASFDRLADALDAGEVPVLSTPAERRAWEAMCACTSGMTPA